jgi:hypothetical protein
MFSSLPRIPSVKCGRPTIRQELAVAQFYSSAMHLVSDLAVTKYSFWEFRRDLVRSDTDLDSCFVNCEKRGPELPLVTKQNNVVDMHGSPDLPRLRHERWTER